jgi:CSLREA domain-containing protein
MSATPRWLRLFSALVLVAGLFGRWGAGPTQALVIAVTTTAEAPGAAGDCTLGEAIQAANTNSAVDQCAAGTSSDVITLLAGAIYTLTTGAPNPFDSFYGPSAFAITSTITVQGNGAVLAHSPPSGPLRFFLVAEPGDLTLQDLTLRGGRARGADGADSTGPGQPGERGHDGLGGAVLQLSFTALALDGVIFSDNGARGGTGGAGFSSPPMTAGGAGGNATGGAVYSGESFQIAGAGATFINNQATGGTGGRHGNPNAAGGPGGWAQGGALFVQGPAALPLGPIVATDNAALGGGSVGTLVTGPGGAAFGGAVYVNDLLGLTLDRGFFYNNRAQGGNSFSLFGGSTAGGAANGGALFNPGGLRLTRSQVISNTARGGNGPAGGAASGGGMMVFSPYLTTQLTVLNTVVLSNTAEGGHGSAASQLGGPANGGGLLAGARTFTAEALAVVGNVALAGTNALTTTQAPALGGGLVFTMTWASLTNVTIAHNQAQAGGGLIDLILNSRTLTLTHVTVYSNSAVNGGGILIQSALTMRNSILAHNAGGNCAGSGPLVLQGDNVQFPGNSCGLATATDPLLGTLGDHGGGTLTVDLQPGSVALDLAGPQFCPPTDQRGLPRPLGAACDLGALEQGGQSLLPLIMR